MRFNEAKIFNLFIINGLFFNDEKNTNQRVLCKVIECIKVLWHYGKIAKGFKHNVTFALMTKALNDRF